MVSQSKNGKLYSGKNFWKRTQWLHFEQRASSAAQRAKRSEQGMDDALSCSGGFGGRPPHSNCFHCVVSIKWFLNHKMDSIKWFLNHKMDSIKWFLNHKMDSIKWFLNHKMDSIKWFLNQKMENSLNGFL